MATVPASAIVQERTRLLPAAAIALAAEALVLGVTIALLTHTTRMSSVSHEAPPTLLTLAAPAPAPQPPQPPQPPAKPVPPPVRPVVPVHHAAPTPVKPVTAAVPKPAPTQVPVQPAATPTEPPSTPAPQPPAQPAPQPAPAAAPVAAAPTPSFEGALRSAIQAALRYPESARMAGMTGRTRVAFKYRDGVVSDVSVVVSSGIGLLDRAALAAVRDATYPKPEPAFVGKTLAEQLWVDFKFDNHE
ncbi:TonB family protein [Paraburkholderia sp. HP33-1]|uniref:TonB family protein n=1 Tax=Paraburkholderia sp. HP33-1 TaxID=2883243 RepID=UPI001F24DB2D|nr:TonB family protein [Paraburkholderia sp. HP33-1]